MPLRTDEVNESLTADLHDSARPTVQIVNRFTMEQNLVRTTSFALRIFLKP